MMDDVVLWWLMALSIIGAIQGILLVIFVRWVLWRIGGNDSLLTRVAVKVLYGDEE